MQIKWSKRRMLKVWIPYFYTIQYVFSIIEYILFQEFKIRLYGTKFIFQIQLPLF